MIRSRCRIAAISSCALQAEHTNSLTSGHRIAEYEVLRVLGAGGFGITYLAFDHRLDGPVAIKEYFPADLATRDDGWTVSAATTTHRETFAWGLGRFLDEARVIHRFRHPNVVRAHRYLEAHGTAYIVMEYVEGESLKAILDRRASLPADEWKPWMEALIRGLAHVHGHGFLHRDIKPANIVIRAEDGEPVLIDFGSARTQHRDRTQTQVLTAGYAPIEQYSTGASQGPPTDIYALAAVSYRVLTGVAAPSAPDRVLEDEYKPLQGRIPGADAAWLAAINHGLNLRPEDRPQDIESWSAALGAETGGESVGAVSRPSRSETGAPTHRTGSESTPRSADREPEGRERPPHQRLRRHLWWAVPALFNLLIVGLRLANGPPTSAEVPETRILDLTAPPTSGAISLSGGFGPDPHVTDIAGGGSVDVSYLGGNCVGYAASAPDLQLHWSGTTDELLIAFLADETSDDATLLVNLPDGSWACNDDSPRGSRGNLNPLLSVSAAQEGRYDIWVGTHTVAPPYIPGRLVIGEQSRVADHEESTPPTSQSAADEGPGRNEESRGTSTQSSRSTSTTAANERQSAPPASVSQGTGSGQPQLGWFTRGSHQDDVLRLQGTPTEIDRYESLGHETWSYGLSRVTISTRTRTVLDWSNYRGQLKVSLLPGSNATNATAFSRGSHQDDVLRLQGTPTEIDRYESLGHETWSYGLSRVTISTRTRTVLDWSNYRGQLKVSLLPGSNATNATTFSRGSHQDDVLRLQGTPAEIDRYESLGHETWSYGLSRVTISTRTRTVLDWSNHGGQLKVSLLPGNDNQ